MITYLAWEKKVDGSLLSSSSLRFFLSSPLLALKNEELDQGSDWTSHTSLAYTYSHAHGHNKLWNHVHGQPWIVDWLNKECRWLLQKYVRARQKLITSYLVHKQIMTPDRWHWWWPSTESLRTNCEATCTVGRGLWTDWTKKQKYVRARQKLITSYLVHNK